MSRKKWVSHIVVMAFLIAMASTAAWEQQEGIIGGFCQDFNEHGTPSVGTVRMPVFIVDFPDVTYESSRLSAEKLKSRIFDPELAGSMTTFEKNASYGALTLDGDVYDYTAEHSIAYYENEEKSFELLAEEVLTALDDTVDYSVYDSDKDGYLDAFVLTIAGDDLYWYGCQATWWENLDFSVDGVCPENYIINDAQPYPDNMDYFVEELCHEFGHCMGLPDYYKYDTDTDYDAMNGTAGSEMMDDMTGDYSMFSKLALGWLKRSDVSIYRGNEESITLHSAQVKGECVIIPINADETDENAILQGEYFLIEYNTPDKNMASALASDEGGIRILHVDAETYEEDGIGAFLYNGFSPYYDTTHQGRRILRLVNDDSGYFHAGDVIDRDTPGFGWYDSDGEETVAPGIEIRIENGSADTITCTITPET